MHTGLIYTPFSDAQVDALNRWQKAGTVHPFTCPSNHEGDRDLIARTDGWHCPTCGYRQMWAHVMMLDEPPVAPI